MNPPSQGDIWQVNLRPHVGHEQGFDRPALVISVDDFNHGPAELVTVVPITTKYKGIPFHVRVDPPEGGLDERSYIKCEDVRTISTLRLLYYRGSVSPRVLSEVQGRLRILLGL